VATRRSTGCTASPRRSPLTRTFIGFHAAGTGIVGQMNLVESIERGLDWLATPKRLPGRLEMETQRGRRLELEVVSLAIRMPIAGGILLRLPLFVAVLPAGSSPIQGSHVHSKQDDD
jgi:hypothetical protein